MTTQVDIYGMRYSIKGSADSRHIQQVADLVNDQMKKIGSSDSRLDVTRIAVLAAINLADELVKVKEEYEKLLQLLEEEANLDRAR